MDLGRAYLYFFNDKDEAQLHGASGITRNFKPKPSFHAMAHLYRTLGDYRFAKAVVKTEGDVYCYEYENPAKAGEKIYVAWSPTGSAKSAMKTLPITVVTRAEGMPLAAGDAPAVKWKAAAAGVEVEVGEGPVYLWGR
jgi:serine/threonine-protein kinase ATR